MCEIQGVGVIVFFLFLCYCYMEKLKRNIKEYSGVNFKPLIYNKFFLCLDCIKLVKLTFLIDIRNEMKQNY